MRLGLCFCIWEVNDGLVWVMMGIFVLCGVIEGKSVDFETSFSFVRFIAWFLRTQRCCVLKNMISIIFNCR